MKKRFVILIALVFIVILIIVARENWYIEKNKEMIEGLQVVAVVESNVDYGIYTICYLKIESSSCQNYNSKTDAFIVELCDSIGVLIYKRNKRVLGRMYQQQIFLEGSKLYINQNNDGWIREYRENIEVYKRRCIAYNPPSEFLGVCR
jgi:hypothetical protein